MQAACSAACVANCWRARPAVIREMRISIARRIIIGEWRFLDGTGEEGRRIWLDIAIVAVIGYRKMEDFVEDKEGGRELIKEHFLG